MFLSGKDGCNKIYESVTLNFIKKGGDTTITSNYTKYDYKRQLKARCRMGSQAGHTS